jgi:hypothetical protein
MKKNITVKLIIIVGILTILFFVWRQYRLRHLSYSPEINKVLIMAGENRSELENIKSE